MSSFVHKTSEFHSLPQKFRCYRIKGYEEKRRVSKAVFLEEALTLHVFGHKLRTVYFPSNLTVFTSKTKVRVSEVADLVFGFQVPRSSEYRRDVPLTKSTTFLTKTPEQVEPQSLFSFTFTSVCQGFPAHSQA